MPFDKNIMNEIQTRLQVLNQRIQNLKMEPSSITLIAVSKFQAFEKIQIAFDLGIIHFGENYLQEALLKIQQAREKNLKITWHFIGKIQSNKTRPIAENFAWAHTIDRLKISERLNHQRPKHLPPLNVCVEINLGNEENKSGTNAQNALPLCLEILKLPHLCLRGLMAIPPASQNPNEQHFYANKMFHLFHNVRNQLPDNAKNNFNVLSMGMSDDLEAALLEGATHIRIGSALFGARPLK